MIDTIPRIDASLPQFLAARARHASDGRLVVTTISGALGALGAAYWHGGGPGWFIAMSTALCLFAFGAWGIADRELGERAGGASRAMLWSLRAVRVAAVILGSAAAALVALSALGIVLGRMIS
jgi:hypothetical protein